MQDKKLSTKLETKQVSFLTKYNSETRLYMEWRAW